MEVKGLFSLARIQTDGKGWSSRACCSRLFKSAPRPGWPSAPRWSPEQERPSPHRLRLRLRARLGDLVKFTVFLIDLISVNECTKFRWLLSLASLHSIGQEEIKGNYWSINTDGSAFFQTFYCLFLYIIYTAYMEVLAVGHNARYGTALCMLSAIPLLVQGTHMHSGHALQCCHL